MSSFVLKVPGAAGPPPADRPVEWLRCDHPVAEVRRKVWRDGRCAATRQCTTCGSNQGAVKSAGLDMAGLPAWDESLSERWLVRCREHTERQQSSRGREWNEWYARYLQSPKWVRLREAVLQRDSFLCQGCRMARATQVHHLNYRRVGNELLFDLISVCDDCHERCHVSGQ